LHLLLHREVVWELWLVELLLLVQWVVWGSVLVVLLLLERLLLEVGRVLMDGRLVSGIHWDLGSNVSELTWLERLFVKIILRFWGFSFLTS